MQTKRSYLVGICAATLIVLLIMVVIGQQNNLSPVKLAHKTDTLPATEQQTIDANALLAIQNALDLIQQAIPALKAEVEQNQLSNEKQLKALEQDIKQMKLAWQHPVELLDQQLVSEPQAFSPNNEAALAEQRAQARVAAFDLALDNEVRDEGWAAQMEDMISSAAQGDLYQGSTISNASCKSTFCRFEAFHHGMDSKDDFELIRRELPNSYHMQNFELEDGSSRTVMYVIRQGEEMNNLIFNTLNPDAE
jgi:gas vesicle protein